MQYIKCEPGNCVVKIIQMMETARRKYTKSSLHVKEDCRENKTALSKKLEKTSRKNTKCRHKLCDRKQKAWIGQSFDKKKQQEHPQLHRFYHSNQEKEEGRSHKHSKNSLVGRYIGLIDYYWVEGGKRVRRRFLEVYNNLKRGTCCQTTTAAWRQENNFSRLLCGACYFMVRHLDFRETVGNKILEKND